MLPVSIVASMGERLPASVGDDISLDPGTLNLPVTASK